METVETFSHGQTAISSSTATQITASRSLNGIQLKNLVANTGIIYIGNSNVTALNGFPLSPGEGLFIPTYKTENIRALAAVNSEKLAWLTL